MSALGGRRKYTGSSWPWPLKAVPCRELIQIIQMPRAAPQKYDSCNQTQVFDCVSCPYRDPSYSGSHLDPAVTNASSALGNNNTPYVYSSRQIRVNYTCGPYQECSTSTVRKYNRPYERPFSPLSSLASLLRKWVSIRAPPAPIPSPYSRQRPITYPILV